MTGGIMPQMFAEWRPAAFIAAAVLVAGLSLGAGIMFHSSDGKSRRAADGPLVDSADLAAARDELQFLQAAYDRVDAELGRVGADDSALSLRHEQEAVRQRMIEVAGRFPVDRLGVRLPPDPVKPVIAAESVAAPPPAAAPPAAINLAPIVLKAGLRSSAISTEESSLSYRPPLPLPTYVERPRKPRHHRAPDKAGKSDTKPEKPPEAAAR